MRKKLTIMVEETLTSEAKKQCIDMGISLSDLVNRLLENYLKETNKTPKEK
ncbi:DUF6364 family protein [Clostridium sporogenes]|uniref:DUF6364 family protein n=1 Tax=Clostridium sporogenes TaxID=1509 RepID=UPI003F92534C